MAGQKREARLRRGCPGHRRAEATPSFGRLCPGMTSYSLAQSRHEPERDAAEQERIVRHHITSGFGGIAHGGDIADPKRQAAHDVAYALDEAEAAIGQRQFWLASFALAHGNAEDPAPMLGQRMRLG